jgi:hypothetical protein
VLQLRTDHVAEFEFGLVSSTVAKQVERCVAVIDQKVEVELHI